MTDKIANAYYFEEEVINTACVDAKIGKPKTGCDSALALFWSFLLRKRFGKDYGFTPTEVLSSVKIGEHKDLYQKDVLLYEAICEDFGSYNLLKKHTNTIMALLQCANLRATECAGKVHIVTLPDNVKPFKTFIDKLKLPLEVIPVNQAVSDLREIHNFYMSQTTTQNS